MKKIFAAVHAFLQEESGVTAIEYGLIAALVGVAIVVGVGLLGGNLNTLFNSLGLKVGAVTVP